jgi:hypothetical protein
MSELSEYITVKREELQAVADDLIEGGAMEAYGQLCVFLAGMMTVTPEAVPEWHTTPTYPGATDCSAKGWVTHEEVNAIIAEAIEAERVAIGKELRDIGDAVSGVVKIALGVRDQVRDALSSDVRDLIAAAIAKHMRDTLANDADCHAMLTLAQDAAIAAHVKAMHETCGGEGCFHEELRKYNEREDPPTECAS